MEKIVIFAVLVILIASLTSIYFLGSGITGMFIGFGQPTDAEWWNITWHYRTRLDINSTQYDRTDWPIEYDMNFTDLIPSGTFDTNSIRVIEYSPSGTVLYELPSQLDEGNGFDASSNAIGTLVFLMNGTSTANSNRTFYVYYDSVENGAKEAVSYPTNLTNSTSGSLLLVNNTFLNLFIDTNRGDNTSGLYRVQDLYENTVFNVIGSERTTEYAEYFNGTNNLSFDLINEGTFTNGSLRTTIEQMGDEILFGDPAQTTGEASIIKTYYIYNNAGPQQRGTFIKVVQRITNDAGHDIQRNSTLSGALALDLNRTFNSGSISASDEDTSNPFSWAWASGTGGEVVGIININQTGTSNYFANENSLTNGRIGMQLDETNVSAGSYIEQVSIIYFAGAGGGEAVTEFLDIKNRFASPITVSQTLPEFWYVTDVTSTNATVFNRNETVLITGNVSQGDPYNLTEYMNATIDMGTVDTGDDQIVVLYDDGSHEDGSADDGIFSNVFGIPNNSNATTWTINFSTYNNYSEFLNSTLYTFNVTDIFNVSVNIANKNPIEGDIVFANIYVKNYNLTEDISGALINCSYNSTEVTNKTDYLNGTYSINFTAPVIGDYILDCNATKNGNFGDNNDTFTSETGKTNASIEIIPSTVYVYNVTLYDNDSFITTANVTNIGNGTAYSSNISLQLLAGWDAYFSLQECGNIAKNENCTKEFNITVPNGTSPGSYYVNVSVNWTNPDYTQAGNITTLNVTIESNPKVSITEGNVTSEAADNFESYIGNFTILSIGNDALQNISFDCYQGDVCNNFGASFNPANISSLGVGENYSTSVNVTVPFDYAVGTYNGSVNVSADNDGYDIIILYVIVPPKTNMSIITSPENYSIDNITKGDNQTFSFNATTQNIGNGSAKYVNVSLGVPSGWSPVSSLEYCNNVTKNENCTKEFNITVPNGTSPGSYYVNVSVNWTNPDYTQAGNITTLNVTIESNPKVSITEGNVTSEAADNFESYIGNFTILSIGNDALQNISFDCYQGDVCNNFSLEFIPSSVSSLDVDNNYSVAVNATVPLGYVVGTYNGSVNVSADNDGYDTFVLNITTLSNRTWTMSPVLCDKSEEPEIGTACEVNVSNLGNDMINFTISPEEGNYTKVNITSFTVDNGLNYTFNVTYNVSNITLAIYNSTFIIDAVDSNANPDNMTLHVNLLPNIPPLIEYELSSDFTEQNSSMEFFVNLTDRSSTDIKWLNVSVTKPDGSSNNTTMTLLNKTGNFSQWYINYTGGLGSTEQRGMYNVTFYSMDYVGNIGNVTTNFTVYKKLLVTASALSNTYYQGDTGSIYFVIKNVSGGGVNNSNVTFIITDSNNNISHYTQQQTNGEGTISPMPTFTLPSDAPIGNYSILTNYTFYEDVLNQTLEFQKNSTFEVQSRTVTVTGLFADLETAVAWYPNNIMRFGILVYNGEGRPVDPDQINLTVYDPADNLYFSTSLSSMTKEATGYYTYSYAMGASSAVGMYLAVLNVTQGSFNTMKINAFRVSQGGPYDVRLRLFENEVPQGDYLDFEIVVENKGEVTQDVFIEYSVTSQTGSYYSFSEAVLTPAFSNQSFTRTAYIYSDQPLGTYVLNARVTYSSIQPVINANTTFTVVSALTPTPAPAPSPTGERPTYYVVKPTQETDADILITGYNNNISLARGITKIEKVTVKNSGRVSLNNVSLFVLGVPTDWFNITPERYVTLVPDNSSVFLIEFSIPENTNVGNYKASLLATSGVVSDQKSIEVNIFSSLKELLEDQIRSLESDLIELKVDIKVAEREGKDVSDVLTIVNTIESYMEDAKDYLKKNEIDLGMDKITSSLTLMKRARDLLDILEISEPEPISIFVILFILILIIVVVFVIVYFWRKKRLKEVLRPYTSRIRSLFERVRKRKVDVEGLQKEKEKAYRMLKVLESEKKEGLVTNDAYKKMKSNLEKRINEIEKKLK